MNAPAPDRRPAGPILVLMIVGLLAAPLAGCSGGLDPDAVRRSLEGEVPGARFEQEVHVHLGRLSTGFVRWIAGAALEAEAGDDPDARRARDILDGIRRMEVAVWSVDGLGDPTLLEAPRGLERVARRAGWSTMVEHQGPGEVSRILARYGGDGALEEIAVIHLEESELAVVRVEGRLQEALVAALAEDPSRAAETALDGEDDDGGGEEPTPEDANAVRSGPVSPTEPAPGTFPAGR